MSNRTWACIECGKTYRRDQNSDSPVKCTICGNECEYVHWKIHVPSPKRKKEWRKFWEIYKKEKRLIELWENDQTVGEINLELLNTILMPKNKNT